LEVPHGLLTQRIGNPELAARDLAKLLAKRERGVRSMRRYFGRFRDPSRPNLEWELLPFSFWDEHVLESWSDGLCYRHIRSRQPILAVGFYVWKPDLATAGLTDAPATDASPTATSADAKPPRKPGTKYKDDWPEVVAQKLIYLARHDPEMLKNVDALGLHIRNFLDDELGSGSPPKDPKALREKIAFLLRLLR
jgi:hypothetical protein